jgi:hypothetical protein
MLRMLAIGVEVRGERLLLNSLYLLLLVRQVKDTP